MTEEQCKKLKEGTKIRFKRNTSCGKSGEIFEVKIKNGIHPLVKLPNGFICDCYNNWELLEPRPFKVGDRVRKISKYGLKIGETGRIKIIDGKSYGLSWDDGEFPNDDALYASEELELVEPVKEGRAYIERDGKRMYLPKIEEDYAEKCSQAIGLLNEQIIDELKHFKLPSLTTRTMRKLSELSASVRRAFSPEQRKLYKAGFIDSCGKYTDAAKDEVLNVLCDEHKAKLVEFAKEAIETAKEDKEDEE